METLTPSQKCAADFVLSGAGNCIIDGSPGNGKSYLLKVLQDELTVRGVKYATIAPRGACAFIVGGDTIHSKLLPLPRNRQYFDTPTELHDALRGALRGNLGQPSSKRGGERSEFWRGLDLLFIDETFLMDAGLFAFTDYTARVERRRDVSFGGVRLVLMGDPCQMGPRGADVYHPFRPLTIPPKELGADEDEDDEDAWGAYGNVCLETRTFTPWSDAQLVDFELTENMRFLDDRLKRVTEAMREGTPIAKVKPQEREFLLERCVDVAPDDALVLYWSREDVAKRNKEMNERIGGDTVRATLGVTVRMPESDDPQKRPATEDLRELRRLADDFVRNLPMEGNLVLRDATRIMIETNMDVKAGAYRGATGVVSSVDHDANGNISVNVILESSGNTFAVKPIEERITHMTHTCRVSYFPLSYGYAKTYDGIQGATVTGKLACAVTPRMPRSMFYVGVTRVRTLDNLYIVANVNKYNNIADPRRILLENPNITRMDPYVEIFLRDKRRRRNRLQADAAVFDSLPRRATETPQPAVCSLCGGAPNIALLPCGDVAACSECWDDARRGNVATCPSCSGLVTGHIRVKLSTVCRKDLM